MTFAGDWVPKPGELLVSADTLGGDRSEAGPSVSSGQQLVVERAVRVLERTKASTGEPVQCPDLEARFADRPDMRGRWVVSVEMLQGKHVVGDEVGTRAIDRDRSSVLRCDWGYAMTVHNAQGSEWARVLVIDHGGYDRVGNRQWNCVAITRARVALSAVRLAKGSAPLA